MSKEFVPFFLSCRLKNFQLILTKIILTSFFLITIEKNPITNKNKISVAYKENYHQNWLKKSNHKKIQFKSTKRKYSSIIIEKTLTNIK